MATIGEMIVKLIADTGNFNTNMAEAATTVKASQDAMAASMQSSMQAFRDFDNIQKGGISTAQDLAAAQATLNAARETGAFTTEELAAKESVVAAAMAKIGTDTKAASAAMGAFAGNSRTAYSASALISDALTGQFSRSRREVAALANETGLMSRVLSAALSPAGILAGVIATLGIATLKAQDDLNSFDESLERTNDYMGIEAGELQAAAQKIESLGVSYGNAKAAVIDLANSGRFTSDQLLQAATTAAEFAQITGEKVSEVDKLMVEMATNPQKALDELVDKYHRVTPAQAEVIEQMIKAGDKAAATAALVQAMGTSVAASFDKQAQHAGMLDKMLITLGRDFGQVWRGIGESLNVATGGGDAAEKLTMLQHQLADMRASGETTGGYAVAYQALEKQAQELQTIIDKQHQSAAAAKQMADAYAAANPSQGSFAAFQKNGLEGIDVNGNLSKQLQTAEAAMKTSYGNREQFEEEYWGTILQQAKSGSAAYIEAWQHVQTLQQQLDQQQLQASEEAGRKASEAARKAAEVAKQAAEGRARVEKQADDEIAQEAQKEAQARQRADMADIEGAHTVGLARIAELRQQAQTEYDMGNISAQQQLQTNLALDQQKLAKDVEYYQKKAALDADDVAKQKADLNAIVAAKDSATKAMEADTDKYTKEEEQKWKQYSQRIAGAFQNSVNSMLFQGQTLKNGLASVAESILETFLESVVEQPLQAFIAAEGQKLAAAIGFGAQKTATENAQRATNAAADVADKTAGVARAAGLAGAQGVASFAAAPWPIDIGAPAFGAAMMASAVAFGSMASAAGGWERVPADGMLTELHRDEMVLPKHIAEPMRQMARNGGGNRGGAIHIHATDASSFKDFLRRNPGALAGGMRNAYRRGHF